VTQARPFIAVVDDEEPVRRALQRLMRAANLDVQTFASGADFLASVSARVPDCLVLDLHMPDLSGFEVQIRLAELHLGVPVVVITGHDLPRARERVLAAGGAAYLRKPVDAQVLLDAVAAAIAASVSPSPISTPPTAL
jgi:FixJ family two-component response regulator